MTAKEKIQNLTTAWYGFALFTGLATLLMNGIGFFSMIAAAMSTGFSIVVAFAVCRLLIGKSSLTRVVLVVLSALSTLLGVLATGRFVVSFFGSWSFSLLGYAVMALAGVYMNARSFRVLTDKSVKAYFA